MALPGVFSQYPTAFEAQMRQQQAAMNLQSFVGLLGSQFGALGNLSVPSWVGSSPPKRQHGPPKSFKDELQDDVDKWLEDVDI